jgi:hypothetical protein
MDHVANMRVYWRRVYPFVLYSAALAVCVDLSINLFIAFRRPVERANTTVINPDRSALGLTKGRPALVLVTSSQCHFCRESLPFYREIVPRARRMGLRILAVTREDPTLNAAYLAEAGVAVDDVISDDRGGIPIDGTPTLVMVPSEGVARLWLGKLSSTGESEVEKALESVAVTVKP